MDQNLKKQIVEKIVYIASNVSAPFTKGSGGSKTIGKGSAGIIFSLIDSFFDEYVVLIKKILQYDGWSENFSERYIDEILQDFLINLLKGGDLTKAEALFDEILNKLSNFNQNQTVYIPMVGISMGVDSLKIGKIDLRNTTPAFMNDLESQTSQVIGKMDAVEKEQLLKFNRERIIKNFSGKVCAEFRLNAEPNRAKERAEEECHRVLDLLRYSIPFIYHSDHNVLVGLEGEVSFLTRETFIISDNKSFVSEGQIVGSLQPYLIDNPRIEAMSKIGVFEVSKILEKPIDNLTDFEEMLLRGIHWFANSQVQYENENKFLSLMTCLETFLTPRDNNPIGTAVAEGVALLIADKLENRKIIKQKVKDFYRMRSGVSHGGRKAILEADLNELLLITKMLTNVMIKRKNEFRSHKELFEWIEAQKLG